MPAKIFFTVLYNEIKARKTPPLNDSFVTVFGYWENYQNMFGFLLLLEPLIGTDF
jgi:hypothetical protein